MDEQGSERLYFCLGEVGWEMGRTRERGEGGEGTWGGGKEG
jgi:hypothetical protein